jgi:branched-chain amino acid aminotransferase
MRRAGSPVFWINNRFVDIDGAKISVLDRGFLYGDGVFETIRSYAGKAFRVDDHLARLFASLKALKIRAPYGHKKLKAAIAETLKANRLDSAYIRLTVTRGEGRFAIGGDGAFRPNAVIVAKPFGDYPEKFYSRGITAAVVRERQNEYSPLCGMKTLNFLNYIVARFDARALGADEAILANTRGTIAEAATSNIFIVKNGSVATPSANSCLIPGVTRSIVIDMAKHLRLRLKEKAVSYAELMSADEIFLTNSLIELLPVTTLDRRAIGNGRPGEITKLLHVSYQKEVIKEVLAG